MLRLLWSFIAEILLRGMYGHLAQFSFYPQMRNCCENFTLISQKFSCALEEVSCVSNSPASSL